MQKIEMLAACVLAGTLLSAGCATTPTTVEKPDALEAAQARFKESFGTLPVTAFGPGPVDGFYEVFTNGEIIYYHPGKDVLFVGEVVTREGRSLTQERLAALQEEHGVAIPLDLALVIGTGPKTIVEFTDPECPSCQQYHTYISKHAAHVTRYIFFTPLRTLHPTAAAKAVHILCAEKPVEAFEAVYERTIGLMDLQDCATGQARLAQHEALAARIGITATPSLLLDDGTQLRGFDQVKLERFLTEEGPAEENAESE
ncbi:MAG: DsbC family protein [Pseudomonadota bacterium]